MAEGNVPLDTLFPQPTEFQIGGETYRRTRICKEDFAACVNRLRQERMEAVLDFHLRRNIPGWADVMARVGTSDPSDDAMWEFVYSLRGQQFVFWRCVNRLMPHIAESQLYAAMNNLPDGGTGLIRALYIDSGLMRVVPAGEAPANPPTTGPGVQP